MNLLNDSIGNIVQSKLKKQTSAIGLIEKKSFIACKRFVFIVIVYQLSGFFGLYLHQTKNTCLIN